MRFFLLRSLLPRLCGLQALLLYFKTHDVLFEYIQLLRSGIDFKADRGSRFINEIHGFVGKKPIGNVPARKLRRRDDGAVGDFDAVMKFVAVLQAVKDDDRLINRWLVNIDRLKAPRERRIFFNIFMIFLQGRRADGVQFASCEWRLQEI